MSKWLLLICFIFCPCRLLISIKLCLTIWRVNIFLFLGISRLLLAIIQISYLQIIWVTSHVPYIYGTWNVTHIIWRYDIWIIDNNIWEIPKNRSYKGVKCVYLNMASQHELDTAPLINVCESKICFILIRLEHYICKMELVLSKILNIW